MSPIVTYNVFPDGSIATPAGSPPGIFDAVYHFAGLRIDDVNRSATRYVVVGAGIGL